MKLTFKQFVAIQHIMELSDSCGDPTTSIMEYMNIGWFDAIKLEKMVESFKFEVYDNLAEISKSIKTDFKIKTTSK